jgi:hypothetical protein
MVNLNGAARGDLAGGFCRRLDPDVARAKDIDVQNKLE